MEEQLLAFCDIQLFRKVDIFWLISANEGIKVEAYFFFVALCSFKSSECMFD